MSYKFKDTPAGKAYEEPGEYQVTVEGIEHKFSSQGDPMILLKLRTSGGALVFDNIGVLTDDASDYAEEEYDKKWGWKVDPMLACFLVLEKGVDITLDNKDWCSENLLGKTGQVLLAKETNISGKVRNKVESYLRKTKGSQPASGNPKPAGTSPTTTTPKVTKQFTKPTPPPHAADDDEIPF
jgi:hypothetical protein